MAADGNDNASVLRLNKLKLIKGGAADTIASHPLERFLIELICRPETK